MIIKLAEFSCTLNVRSDVAIRSKGDMNLDKIKEHLTQVATKSLKSVTVVTGPDSLHGFTTVKEILDRYEQILKEAIRTAEEPIIVSSIYETTSLLSSKQNHMRKGINVGIRRLCDTLDCIYIDNDKNFISNEDSHSSMLLAANLGFRDFVSVNTAKRHLTYHPTLHYNVATQSQEHVLQTEIGSQTWNEFHKRNPPPTFVPRRSYSNVVQTGLKMRQNAANNINYGKKNLNRLTMTSYNKPASANVPRCFKCGESSHIMSFCRHRTALKCNACGRIGHKSKYCGLF